MTRTFLSVCSGIEAASVAWEPLGWRAVGFAEIDKAASRLLAHYYGSNMPGEPLSANGVPNFGDFTTIDLAAVKPVDVLIGGTPCQAFSFAGKRLSLADARGNLSLAYAVLAHDLARSHGLRWAVWENVPGVLSTDDNAFGCLLGGLVGADDPLPLPPGLGRWPDQGMVAGPRARAAWRIFDSQYFGVAQRRRRVFVVVGLADGTDPAAVLFERQGLRRHPPARGETGQGVAVGTLAGTSPGGGWRIGPDEAAAGHLIAATLDASFGRLQGCSGQDLNHGCSHLVACEVADTLTVGANQTTGYVGDVVAHTLRGEGFASEDGSGRGIPLVPVCFDARQSDVCVHGDLTMPLDTKFPGPAVAFDTTQITSPTNRSNPKPGDPCHTLAAGSHAPSLAYGIRSDALREGVAKTPSADASGIVRLRDPGIGVSEELAPTLDCGAAHVVANAWAVRRLTPTECERLQAYRDGYTAIPGAADGPRYKQLGNSMTTTVIAWLGRRIDAFERGAL